MASKVLVPVAPFVKLQVKKTPPDSGSGFIIAGDPTARVAHLEDSLRFLQEQHWVMLSSLHAEIEALRERNRDLQFQLIFNKESTPKPTPDAENSEEAILRREVSRLDREAVAARGEARAAETRAIQLQRLVDEQAEKLRELELKSKCASCGEEAGSSECGAESRGELRARLSSAERLVRRLRADAERQRRELQCMKNSLHASLRASGLDGGYGYQNNYHFPPVHTADFWREPVRDDLGVGVGGRGRARRPLTLPDLAAHHVHRSTVYANNHARGRTNGYEHKNKKGPQTNGDVGAQKTPEDAQECRLKSLTTNLPRLNGKLSRPVGPIYPELKVVVTKLIPREHVSQAGGADGGGGGGAGGAGGRGRSRRVTHRKHAPDHT